MEYITMIVEVRGREFDIEVYAKLSSGGSYSWGSDEPPWFGVDFQDIYNRRRKKLVSDRLYNKIVELYEDHIVEQFQQAYM
jgi:hypothetical protein